MYEQTLRAYRIAVHQVALAATELGGDGSSPEWENLVDSTLALREQIEGTLIEDEIPPQDTETLSRISDLLVEPDCGAQWSDREFITELLTEADKLEGVVA